jgi:hypothetical protein
MPPFSPICKTEYYNCKAEGTPRKLATATQSQFPKHVTCVQLRLLTTVSVESHYIVSVTMLQLQCVIADVILREK